MNSNNERLSGQLLAIGIYLVILIGIGVFASLTAA